MLQCVTPLILLITCDRANLSQCCWLYFPSPFSPSPHALPPGNHPLVSVYLNYFLKYILLIMLLQLSHYFSPFYSLHPSSNQYPPQLSSCPWVIHTSSLASPCPMLLLTSPWQFCTYHLCFLFPVPLPPFFPLTLPADNPPCDLHFCDSVPVLVVCLVHFCFFRFSCWW